MHVRNVLHAARWKCRTQKNHHLGTIAQLCRATSSQLRHVSTIGKNLLNCNTSPICPHNMVNFGPLPAKICWRVLGTPTNFNGFWDLAALLHSTLVVDVSQTLRRWTEGATYIRQGDHHVGHWPTFQFVYLVICCNNVSVLHRVLAISILYCFWLSVTLKSPPRSFNKTVEITSQATCALRFTCKHVVVNTCYISRGTGVTRVCLKQQKWPSRSLKVMAICAIR